MFDNFSFIFKNFIWTYFVVWHIIYAGECPVCTWGKVSYFSFLKWKVIYMFKSYVLLLIFCLIVNSISENGILKSPTVAELFISLFNSFSFLLHIFWSSIVSSYFYIHLPSLYISYVKFINSGIGQVLSYMELEIFWDSDI